MTLQTTLDKTTNVNAIALAKRKGYAFDTMGKITNADTIIKTKTGTIAHATKCPLGEGQNASIFLAQNLDSGEFLAVKIYDKSRNKESYHVDSTNQIEIEQKVLSMLNMNRGLHKNTNDTLHVYMPFIDGVDLEKAKAHDIGSLNDCLDYAQLATNILEKMHQHNFIHADLHAGNIMICPNNKSLYFVDFEKCKYMEPQTQDLEIWGRPSFLPKRAYDKSRPKNGAGDPIMVPVNKETDKYGLGVALFIMFTKVLGEDVLSIDNNGHIEIKRIPKDIPEDLLKDLSATIHMLTQPNDKYLADVATRFNLIKNKIESINEQSAKTFLPSSTLTSSPNITSKTQPAQQEQIIGTQAIGAAYHFEKDKNPVIEQAEKMLEMGYNMIKVSHDEKCPLDKLMSMPFSTYFLWWRSGSKKCDLSEADLQAEYKATYDFSKSLLLKNANVEKIFYLGNWEGDWYLLPDYDATKNASPERIKGMIDWLNIRQKAVDDARQDVGQKSKSKIYHYAELNRVRDAMDKNMDRLVNKVLPNTNVDYVSYSSYDVQQRSQDTINDTLKYIGKNLKPKAGISGPRVFIGEYGVSAKDVGFDPQKHEQVNRDITIKYLKSGVPYILYWQIYNNEVQNKGKSDEKQVGFWLINDKNEKQPLYYTFEGLLKAQKEFKNVKDESCAWLENTKNKTTHRMKS